MLRVLKEAQDEVSGENIARELGISRTAVWKQVQKLRSAGYDIEAHPSRGYMLISTPDRLTKEELEVSLPLEFCDHVIFCDKVGSTNDLAKQMAGSGKFDPVGLVVAEEQTGGRGRFRRVWTSPRGGIWMSLIVRPKISVSSAGRVALLAAVAVAEAIISTTSLPARIKWPNDILVNEKKVCGILTEMAAEPGLVEYLVVGIGLNSNFEADRIKAHRTPVTTIQSELGRPVERPKMISEIVRRFLSGLASLERKGDQTLIDRWRELSVTLGQDIRLQLAGQTVAGLAVDINDDGALVVDLASGERRVFTAGEVSFGDN